MKKFYLSFGNIRAREVLRETGGSVYTLERYVGKEQRIAKETSYGSWHDTWEDAHARLLDNANQDVRHAQDRLAIAEDALRRVLEMKKP